MKQIITIGAHVVSLLIFLATIDLTTLLFRFFTIGELPGATMFVPADTMFAATTICIAIVTLVVIFRIISNFRLTATSTQLPKRRFSSIQ